jgi:hypothetical protein
LETLRDHQGPSGQIPSNVATDGSSVSYGGTAGRVDATLWYLAAIGLYGRLIGDDDPVEKSRRSIERALAVVRAWEHNDGSLVYVPQAGDWADEYVLSGYLLYDQALRWLALQELDRASARLGWGLRHERGQLGDLIAERYASAAGEAPYFVAGFHAGARFDQFDSFGNALCCLLGIGSERERHVCLKYAAEQTRHGLVPAFAPEIAPDDPEWPSLQRAASHGFRNYPGRYHNGGLWPIVTAFWALAARRHGHADQADRWLAGIRRANRSCDEGFPEFLDAATGEPGGVRGLAWSAAAEILAGVDAATSFT